MCQYDKVARQFDDWPNGVSNEDKEVLMSVVRDALTRHPQGLEMWELYDSCKQDERAKAVWGDATLLDWIYATVERAARHVGVQRWHMCK